MKNVYTFTKDYLDCLAYAWVFAASKWNKRITIDDIIAWMLQFTNRLKSSEVMRLFLWFKDVESLKELIKKYWEFKKLDDWEKLKLTIDSSLNKHYTYLKDQWIEKLTFLALVSNIFHAENSILQEYMQENDIDKNLAQKKIIKVMKIIQKVWIAPSEFFATLQTMLDRLWLDIEHMDMMVDMGTIAGDDLEISELFTDEDTDVLEPSSWSNDEIESDTPKDKKSSDEKKLTIEYFATDLTDEAKQWMIDPIIGRSKEIDQIIYTLMRKTKNNPLLIGEAGVGKTAVVEWIAQRIVAWEVPKKLENKRLMMLDVWSLVAWTKYRGEFESRLKSIIDEAIDPINNIILFVDEAHTLIGAWNAEWSADAANMLKPMLARGKLQMIGATTFDEYQKHIEKDPALKRRFQELHVEEPTQTVAIEIMQWLKENFEEFHGVNITDDAINAAVKYSIRYMMNKHLPDKAIDLVDEACARISTLSAKLEQANDYTAIEKDIEKIHKKIEQVIKDQDYFKAAELKQEQEELKKKLTQVRQQHTLPKHLRPSISEDDIGTVLADKLWIPVTQITDNEIEKLTSLDTHLKTLVLGQDEAVNAVVSAIKRSRLSAFEHKKPIGSFLFLGASWVGKTYIAKLLAKEYFGDDKALIRVDMSEYMEKYSVSKLIGSAPWYVWYEEWGMLTEQVRRKPYSVVLFDEIEKASPDVLNVLLQILDEWHLKDNKWRWIDFKNTIIILTSNLGSQEFGKKQTSIWFANQEDSNYKDKEFDLVKSRVLEVVKKHMKPELLNRLSAQIVFKPLTKERLAEIFMKELKQYYTHWTLKYPEMKLPRFGKKKVSDIIDKIYEPAHGARPIHRYLHNELEPILIEKVIKVMK